MNTESSRLMLPPSPAMLKALDSYGEILRRTLPLKPAHFRMLPRAIADLSRILTEERRDLVRPYWSDPRSLGAYAWYFLPWNLYRLCWLLPQIELPLKDGDLVLDPGSGPLTLPQALWLARPDLRTANLTFVCSDTASRPLELGRSLLFALMDATRSKTAPAPWKIRIVRADLEQALREAGRKPGQSEGRVFECADKDQARPHGASLILAGNILNELKAPRAIPMDLHMRSLSWKLARALAPGGRALLVEPGNRLGGKILGLLRKNALDLGLAVLSPCTHQGECPMLAPRATSWCHFSLEAELAPDWLKELSARAGLEKERASLSALLLQRPLAMERLMPEAEFMEAGLEEADEEEENAKIRGSQTSQDRTEMPRNAHGHAASENKGIRARVLSDAFSVPEARGRCRYACTEQGLILLENAGDIPESTQLGAYPALPPRRDPKTGARFFTSTRK